MSKLSSAVNDLRVSMLRFRAVVKIPSAFMVTALTLIAVATDTLNELTPAIWQRLMLIGGLGLLTVVFFRNWEKGFVRSESSYGQVDEGKLTERHAAVVTLGLKSDRPDSPFAKLLSQARNLQALALVATPEVEALGATDRILSQLLPASGLSIEPENIRVYSQRSALSVADAHQCITEALTWLLKSGYGPHELVVDISDGRRPTHLGAAQAANNLSVEVEYLGPQWNHLTDQPVEGTEAFKVVSEIY